MKEAFYWLQSAQHEWWFLPSFFLLMALVFGIAFGVRVAWTRFIGRLMSPRMKLTEDQVEAQWATPADLEQFGLVSPAKKGIRKWIAR